MSATLVDALYEALQADALFVGKVYRDRPPGAAALPYAVIRGDIEHDRNLDLDGTLKRIQRRIDVLADDGEDSDTVEAMGNRCAVIFDAYPPTLTVTGFATCGVSAQGPIDLPPDQETYGRSVTVTVVLKEV